MATDLKVTLSGSDTGLSRVLGQVERSAQRTERSLEQMRRSTEDTWAAIARAEEQLERESAAVMQRRHDAYTAVGKGALIMGVSMTAGLAVATKAAMDWETAWTGVLKTVDGTPEQMAALEAEIRGLAKTLPFAHEEIAAVAEAAGQLGIKRESIADFTSTVLALGVSTNMTAEDAAMDFARLATIMQMPTDKMSNLGSTAVALGNNFAATEGEIVALGLRLAGTSKQASMSEADVFGLAAAMSQVGIEAEAGGTAMSQTIAKIQKDIESGSDRVAKFARVAGMSADEFSAAWREDAAGALTMFLTGLGQMSAQGGSALQTLDELGIKGQRQADTLLRLSGAGTTVADALATANTAFAENNALQEEAARFYATSENRLKAAKNEFADLSIELGAVLLPVVVAVGETFADLTTFVDGLPGPAKAAVVVTAALAAGLTLSGGAALVAIPKIAAFKAAVDALEAGAMKRTGTRAMALGGMLAGPLGLGLAAATIGVGIFAARQGEAAQKADALRATLDEQTGALTANSRAWAIDELVGSGAMKQAEKMGIDLELVTAAALGNADAMDALYEASWRYYSESAWYDVKGKFDVGQLTGDVEKVAAAVESGREKQELATAATDAGAAAATAAADAQDGLAGSWAEGAVEAESLTDAAKGLREAFEELSGGFLNEREASRQVRSSLREIREAMADYKKEHKSLSGAFTKGTESGDAFAAMLDGLAKDYQAKIAASVEAGKSEEEVGRIYDRSRAKLEKVATQMGMTKGEAADYIAQVLETPEMVSTSVKLDTSAAESAWAGFQSRMASALAPVFAGAAKPTPKPKVKQADGSVLSFYADGGVENHVAQIAPAGAWRVWAEPETGGESYIPHAPGKRARSLDIWAQTGRILGVQGFADGGVVGGALGTALADQSLARAIGLLATASADLAAATKSSERAEKRVERQELKVERQEKRADKASDRLRDGQSALKEARSSKPTQVELLQQRTEVRDLQQSLAAKGKERLSGLERQLAQARLKEAQAELSEMRSAGKRVAEAKAEVKALKAAAVREAKALAAEEAALKTAQAKREAEQAALKAAEEAEAEAKRKAEQAAEDARRHAADLDAQRQERADLVAGQYSLIGGGSLASKSRGLDRLLGDVTAYNAVYSALVAGGASGWLLGQMDAAARAGDYRGAIRFGRQLLGDRSMWARIEEQGGMLGGLGFQQQQQVQQVQPNQFAMVGATPATLPAYVTPATTVTNNQLTFHLSSLDPAAIAQDVVRRLAHEGMI